MRPWLVPATAAALILVAACNRGSETSGSPDHRVETARNVASGAAAPADIAAVMHARHEHYEDMGKAMKGIGDQLRSGSPSVEAVQRHAALIAGYGPQILSWFPQGSGPESGRRTRAKAEIWSDSATFRQRARAFEAESARFSATARTGDLAAVRAGMGGLGRACRNCHDLFRAPEH